MSEQLVLERPGARLQGERVGAGPSALLLHAGGERRSVWRPIMLALARSDFATLAFDQRGHGDSGRDSGGHIAAFGDDATAMLEMMITPIVVGASLGGFAALMALRASEVRKHVAGLILVDVTPDPDPTLVRPFLAALGRDLVQSALVQDIFDNAATLREAAGALDLPVLLVRAGMHTAMTDAAVERLHSLIPQLQVVTAASASHLIARTAPEALTDIISGFLAADAVRDRRIQRMLESCGCGNVSHPGGTLLEHLNRVADTLRREGAAPVIVDAARLHAAYGTNGFDQPFARPDDGWTVAAVAGPAVATLVSLYGRCDRSRSYPTWSTTEPILFDRNTGAALALDARTRTMLIDLTVVNELDVLTHDAQIRREHGVALLQLFAKWQPFMSDSARRALARSGKKP
jgi:pimeloyl-ACP methyl ester carboxylesterase